MFTPAIMNSVQNEFIEPDQLLDQAVLTEAQWKEHLRGTDDTPEPEDILDWIWYGDLILSELKRVAIDALPRFKYLLGADAGIWEREV